MAVQLKRWLFTVDEYDRMVEAGILNEDDRVELIEGEIVETAPIGVGHASCVNRLTLVFVDRFRDVATVTIQNPVILPIRSEPQPDLALLRLRADFYATGHPRPEDILLLIEVADTTARLDRQVKIPLYARHGVPEAWLVDLPRHTITVFRDPGPDGYRTELIVHHGDRLSLLHFPDREISADDMLGPPPGPTG